MSSTQAPWSVRGVTREARAKAAKAAERRRMTIGEWVTNALITVANDELGRGTPGAATSVMAEEAAGGTLQLHSQKTPAQIPVELTVAVETLTRRIEESGEREKAVGDLVERLDALVHADHSVTRLTDRVAGLDGRDRDLAATSERLVATERSTEQRLAVLTSAVVALGDRLEWAKETKARAATVDDVAHAIAPLRMAIDSYIVQRGGMSVAAQPNDEMRSAAGDSGPAAMPTVGRGRVEAVTQAIAPLDYDRLHERAIGNTRRQFADDSEPAAKNGSLMSRLFGD